MAIPVNFTVQFWDNLTNGLSSTGGRWNDVTGSSSTSSPVLVGWTVNGLLGGGDRVDSGHQTFLNTEGVVDNLGQWSQTVGGTGSVGNNALTSVLVFVDTNDEHWSVSGRSGDDNLLGTSVNVLLGTLELGENTSGVNNQLNTLLAPWNLGSGLSLGGR
ncbi:glyceraldehyde-3-phosphate dehydrogenase [Clavispora lusitaniae ATCC 42720]|uniref:Glyceraldehyde-3-phosphate dehydrogenase n=1 Tax=Clavispora lusitaniae (strain ATCC 42720) TaxID=306902 RepID=C4Y5J0_CLAL4|nr:glyceraldehyde-3-phosphate dehydrogenase [Clavispora lusitaniae ATCC 42720]EEQ39295.1 glyceraldehyde-3-phosphate dehydrogenase [Clavispora lusitaniae ATCC 42720]